MLFLSESSLKKGHISFKIGNVMKTYEIDAVIRDLCTLKSNEIPPSVGLQISGNLILNSESKQ